MVEANRCKNVSPESWLPPRPLQCECLQLWEFYSINQTLNFSGKYNAVQAVTLHRVLWGTYQLCQEVWFGSEAFLVNCQLRPTWECRGAGNTSAGMTRIWSKKMNTSFMRVPCKPGMREMMFVKFCEREGMKVSNIFIILQHNVWWGLNCKCVILISVNGRKKQRRNGNLYVHFYVYLKIYSQSVTFRRAHLAAAVSGDLWKSHRSRSGHTNRVKLQVAGVLHFVIQELSWCILILPIKKSHTRTQSSGKEHWRLWTKPVKIKERQFRPLEKLMAFSQEHHEHTISGSSPHISNVSKW